MNPKLQKLERPWEYSAFPLTVRAKRFVAPDMIRITLSGDALRHFAPWGLDQRIKLVIPMADASQPDFGLLEEPTPNPKHWYTRWKALPAHSRNALRTYTPAEIRVHEHEIDVDFFIHEPSGPASAWAQSCQLGDGVVITGPDVRVGYTGYGIQYTPPAVPHSLLLIGDNTAVPAINSILRHTPLRTPVNVILHVSPGTEALFPKERKHCSLTVVNRSSASHADFEAAVQQWCAKHRSTFDTDGTGYAWIAGETETTKRIRRILLSELKLPKERVAFLGYWKEGGPLAE